MNLHIQWTHIALQSLSNVLGYTFEEFGEQQLHQLSHKIMTTVNRLSTFPQLGKTEDYLTEVTGIEYRSVVVIKEIKLIYTVNEDSIYIEYVKNNRQDDSKLLEKLEKY